MQGELSLNKIKVVRNDLTDTDLEIARVKPPATQAAMRQVRALPRKANPEAPPGDGWPHESLARARCDLNKTNAQCQSSRTAR